MLAKKQTGSVPVTLNLLKKYMQSLAKPYRSKFRTRLAIALNVSEVYLRAIECGIKQLQPWMSDTIEKHTNGHIRAIQVYRDYSVWQHRIRRARGVKNAQKYRVAKTK